MTALTFVSLFESNQNELRASLSGCSLPKDAQKIQSCVTNYLSTMFDSNGELRMSLTQSEDYILQAAISLLNAQQKMASVFAEEASKPAPKMPKTEDGPNTVKPTKPAPDNVKTLSGSAIGGIGGGLIFGTWGAVFGAIAGTALVLYCATNNPVKPTTPMNPTLGEPLKVENLCKILRGICEGLDNLITTYRVQVKRIENSYSQKVNEFSVQDECSSLLDQVVNTYNIVMSNKDTLPAKLVASAEMMADSLENYNLAIENGKLVNVK